MSIEDIPICVDCQNGQLVLGKSTHVYGISSVFYTISPDPEINEYLNKLPDSQHRYIVKKFNLGYTELQKHIKTLGYTMHFEFNKCGNLHIHGLIYIDSMYSGYDKNVIIMSKIFHRYFGRQYVKSSISSRFEWVKDFVTVCRYVNKANEFCPIHKITEQKQITDYLTTGVSGDVVPALQDNYMSDTEGTNGEA